MSPKRNPAAALEAGAAATTPPPGGLTMKVGRLVVGSAPGKLKVDFDGNSHGPLAARTVVALDQRALDEAIAVRRTAVLLFEHHAEARRQDDPARRLRRAPRKGREPHQGRQREDQLSASGSRRLASPCWR